jgi:hypothetical protein
MARQKGAAQRFSVDISYRYLADLGHKHGAKSRCTSRRQVIRLLDGIDGEIESWLILGDDSKHQAAQSSKCVTDAHVCQQMGAKEWKYPRTSVSSKPDSG